MRRLQLGIAVGCVDGEFGDLADIVIDPGQRRVTHLVIQPSQLPGSRRLAPMGLATKAANSSEIVLRCTVKNAQVLPSVQEVASLSQLRSDDPEWDVGVKDVLPTAPYDAGAMVEYYPDPDPDITMLCDRVPKGEVEIRHGSEITTADGHDAGSIDGLLVEGEKITRLVLHHGFLWKRRELTVPIDAVETLSTDKVVLRLTAAELGKLPSERIRH